MPCGHSSPAGRVMLLSTHYRVEEGPTGDAEDEQLVAEGPGQQGGDYCRTPFTSINQALALAPKTLSVGVFVLLATAVVLTQQAQHYAMPSSEANNVMMWDYKGIDLKSGDHLLDRMFNETLADCVKPVKDDPPKRGQCYDALFGKIKECKPLRLQESPPATCARLRKCFKGEPHPEVNPCEWLCKDGNASQAVPKKQCLEAYTKATEWGAKCNETGYEKQEFKYLEKVNEYAHQCLSFTTTTTTTPPSLLYCWALVVPWSYEVKLVLLQEQLKAGTLDCDATEIFADRKMRIGTLETVEVEGLDLHCKINKYTLTAENTPIFRQVWRKVLDRKTWQKYDWTVKVDLDAVFFPGRLRSLLYNPWFPSHAQLGTGLWLNNCWRGLHGPIEVLSRQAMKTYDERWWQCNDICEQHPQEDVYLRACMEHIGVWRHDMWELLAEDHCDHPNYKDCSGNWVAFHPFKDVDEWKGCFHRAIGSGTPI